MKKPSISRKYLGFGFKNLVFQVVNLEILDFSRIKFEIQDISSKIPSISKKGVKSRVLSGPYVYLLASASADRYTCVD